MLGSLYKVVAVVALSVGLVACDATVGVVIGVREDATADISLTVRFAGEVANELRDRPGLIEALEETFEARGLDAKRSSSNGSEIWRVNLGVVQPVSEVDEIADDAAAVTLVQVSDMTGIGAIAVERRGDTALVKVATVDPIGLRVALANAIGDAPDGAALYGAFAANTYVSVAVQFPGEVLDAGAFNVTEQRRAVRTVTLADSDAGAFSVLGSLVGPADNTRLFVGGGIAAVVLLLGVALVATRPEATQRR